MSETGIGPGQRDGELELCGVLDFRTGAALREAGRRLIQGTAQSDLILDCRGVEHSTSVGLALLLAWLRDAAAAGKQLRLRGLPHEMQQIAEVSGLVGILPISS